MYENKDGSSSHVCCASLKNTSFHGLTISVARWKKTEKYIPLPTKNINRFTTFLTCKGSLFLRLQL